MSADNPRHPRTNGSPVGRRWFLAGAAAVAGAGLSRLGVRDAAADPGRATAARRVHPALAQARTGRPTPLAERAALARDVGGGEPVCLVDLDAIDANVDALTRFSQVHGWALRPALTALSSPELAGYVLGLLDQPRGLVAHLRDVAPTLTAAPAGTDLLVAHTPTTDELARYVAAGPPAAGTRVRVALDDVALLDACTAIVRDAGWDEPLEVCVEFDSGMGRGGFRDPDDVAAFARRLRDAPDAVRCTAVLCYDGHATLTSADAVRRTIARDARARLRELEAVLLDAAGDAIDPADLAVSGPGSSNYRNWAEGDEITEISPGSALTYARYLSAGFDDEELTLSVTPAVPVARRLGRSPRVPLTDFAIPGSNREQLLLTGGGWPDATGTLPDMVWPEGLADDSLHGGRRATASSVTAPEGVLEPGDYVLLWPEHSGAAISRFSTITALRGGDVAATWATSARWGG